MTRVAAANRLGIPVSACPRCALTFSNDAGVAISTYGKSPSVYACSLRCAMVCTPRITTGRACVFSPGGDRLAEYDPDRAEPWDLPL